VLLLRPTDIKLRQVVSQLRCDLFSQPGVAFLRSPRLIAPFLLTFPSCAARAKRAVLVEVSATNGAGNCLVWRECS